MSRTRVLIVLVVLGIVAFVGGCFLFPNRPPEAHFVVSYGVDPEDAMVVDLDASASTDPDGDTIVAYMWTFGDEVQIITPLDYSSKTVPFSTLRIRYPEESVYTVQLLVRDERDAVSEVAYGTVTLPNIPVGPTE